MNRIFRKRPSPAMLVAMIALFVALGGGAVASVAINQVRSANIKNGEVKTADLANAAVTSLKIANGAVKSNKLLDGTIATADLAAGAVTPAKISGVPAVRANSSANQSIPNGAFTAVALNAERFDASNMHRTDADTSRLTVTTPGVYLLTANITWEPNATGAREVNIRKNGTAILSRVVENNTGANTVDQVATTLTQLAAGDYVEVVVRHNAGVAINVLTAPEFSPEFSAVWVAP